MDSQQIEGEEEELQQRSPETSPRPSSSREQEIESNSNISALNKTTYENTIVLAVKSQGTMPDITFRIKKDRLFSKMFSHYHKQSGLQPGSVRFLFDGTRINETQTPQDLGMEDNDVIDAVIQQTGGGR